MKKTVFANVFAVMGIILSSNPIAAAAAHANFNSLTTNSDSLIGYLPMKGESIRPLGITEKDDGSLVVAAAGNLSEGNNRSGQIWTLDAGESEFYQNSISASGQDYYVLSSVVYSKDRDSLFVCSLPNKGSSLSSTMPSSVVEFKMNNTTGEYEWSSVMNFSNQGSQSCKGLAIVGDHLFALNSFFGGDDTIPAVYSANIKAPVGLPVQMDVALRYSSLEFSNEDLPSSTRKWPISLPDISAAKNQEDGKYSVFILDSTHNRIDAVNFVPGESGQLTMYGELKQMPFDVSVDAATAMVNMDDKTFFVASGDESDDYEEVANFAIYKLQYKNDQTEADIELIAKPYAPVASLLLSKDRLGTTHEQVIFAPIVGRFNNGAERYNVAEYQYTNINNNKK